MRRSKVRKKRGRRREVDDEICFFEKKTAYEVPLRLVGSERGIRDRRWAAGKVADGANWAAGKVAEGAKWLADSKLNPANWW